MSRDIVISIDAMGGDTGPSAVVGGMVKSARKNNEIRYIVHGDEAVLRPLIEKRRELIDITEIRHADDVIPMTEKPSHAMRHGKNSSMWATLQTVEKGDAAAAVSCGNTGALMAISMLRLRKAPGVDRPAIAVLWPNKGGDAPHNIVLDVGADIKAEAKDLVQYAIMGAVYARQGLELARPKVGLLNVGTEDHKGRAALQEAARALEELAKDPEAKIEFVGFVEGSDMASEDVDVIVTDGFTGNVALKTAEGTAQQIRGFLREAMEHTIFSRIGALFALTSLRRLQKRLDPRRVNGGVFLGLNGAVVKSHGSADATGVSAAIKLAFRLAKSGFTESVTKRVAEHATKAQSESES
ncbi:phosphate acyltransferase PlsX [Pontivivens insulae]|uniref:Phosphate acyltransferase n=1 Tax=Pontivivens insulae TaxID=1639689 RepID=A0A2R8ACW3_9RHOB|nr:phosphate acyltransferase PlsX [Pontivivens insulae]RED13826.1 phosphate:acyl-[acyl carrier protein] acyltransferase [Pontivivens insulae]SPF29900.1 Phosphate acyltransferase [Pontivivens insulae]